MLKSCKKILLLSLLAFTLLGVQAIQNSPLHDHAHHMHVLDCGLCHFSLTDYGSIDAGSQLDIEQAATAYATALRTFYSFRSYSPYQGRSPPAFFS